MQSLRRASPVPMHEEVLSNFPDKSFGSLRRPSFAGHGWPERMRTTVFAFMGLTAAGGLALVAIFAQVGFPLLSPAPLPSDPSRSNAVAEAEVVIANHGLGDAVPAARVGGDAGRPAAGGPAVSDSPGDAEGGSPAPVASPQPVVSGGVGAATGGGGDAPSSPAAPTPAPVSTSTPKPAAPPVSAPPSRPETTLPEPAPAAAPGNSSSGAAAEHASERGVEASSSANGKALGHEK